MSTLHHTSCPAYKCSPHQVLALHTVRFKRSLLVSGQTACDRRVTVLSDSHFGDGRRFCRNSTPVLRPGMWLGWSRWLPGLSLKMGWMRCFSCEWKIHHAGSTTHTISVFHFTVLINDTKEISMTFRKRRSERSSAPSSGLSVARLFLLMCTLCFSEDLET